MSSLDVIISAQFSIVWEADILLVCAQQYPAYLISLLWLFHGHALSGIDNIGGLLDFYYII